MNFTEIVHFTINTARHRVFNNVQFLYSIFWLSLRLARVGLRSSIVLPFGIVLDICGDLLRLSSTLACVWIFVISISLYKSLKPRYNFYHDTSADTPSGSSNSSCNGDDNSELKTIDRRNEIFSPSTRRLEISGSGWPIKRYIEKKFPFALRLLSRLRSESRDVNQICTPALSVPDVESVYKRLSWSHTQVDIESVKWLNQTLLTLWPSIKTLLNLFVFNDLLKPKRAGNKDLASESKKLSRPKPKLSVYISSRRQLDLVKQIEADLPSRYQSFIHRSLFTTTIYLLKLAIVYLKQFIIDYVCYLFQKGKKKSNSNEGQRKFEINLDKLLAAKKLKKMRLKQEKSITKSWAGFDMYTANRTTREGIEKKRKLKSAPPHTNMKTRMTHGLLGPRGMAKLHRRRLKLANRFKRAYDKTKPNNELTIERIQLGNSIPMINGLKYIDERDDLMIDPVRTSRHLVGSDERNMRFVSELSYESDEKFQIRLSLYPMLGTIRLVNFKAQIRCYLTLNHTINELNRHLKIFDTPDDVLFPAINYVQLSLVDVPSFDWKLDRPKRRKPLGTNKQNRLRTVNRMSDYISRLIDPVDIINHTYFKFIVHSIIYIGLKWFQPFDIRIGPHLYLKTIC